VAAVARLHKIDGAYEAAGRHHQRHHADALDHLGRTDPRGPAAGGSPGGPGRCAHPDAEPAALASARARTRTGAGPRSLDRYCELDRLAVWLASCEQSVLVLLAGEPVRDIRPPGSPTSRDGTRCYPPTSRTGVRDEEVAGFNCVTPTTSNGLVSGS